MPTSDAVDDDTGLLLWRYRERRRLRAGDARITSDTDDDATGDVVVAWEGCCSAPEWEEMVVVGGLKDKI